MSDEEKLQSLTLEFALIHDGCGKIEAESTEERLVAECDECGLRLSEPKQ